VSSSARATSSRRRSPAWPASSKPARSRTRTFPLPAAVGDYDELTIVFQNLVDNAIKYAKPNTTVRVAARAMGRDRVAVADEGDGIPAAHLQLTCG
jgi:signal transduction histidine kinase